MARKTQPKKATKPQPKKGENANDAAPNVEHQSAGKIQIDTTITRETE